ncbi:universal stress protein [Streptomyces sp. NPDC055607]
MPSASRTNGPHRGPSASSRRRPARRPVPVRSWSSRYSRRLRRGRIAYFPSDARSRPSNPLPAHRPAGNAPHRSPAIWFHDQLQFSAVLVPCTGESNRDRIPARNGILPCSEGIALSSILLIAIYWPVAALHARRVSTGVGTTHVCRRPRPRFRTGARHRSYDKGGKTINGTHPVQSTGRVVVGVSGSSASTHALARAVAEARRRGQPLVPVLAWSPPGSEWAIQRVPSPDLDTLHEETARARLRTALTTAFEGTPRDVVVTPFLVRGEAAHALVSLAPGPGDLIVLGGRDPHRTIRLPWGRTRRRVLARARTPVLLVPPPTVSRRTRRALARLSVEDFEATASGRPPHRDGGRAE